MGLLKIDHDDKNLLKNSIYKISKINENNTATLQALCGESLLNVIFILTLFFNYFYKIFTLKGVNLRLNYKTLV